MDIEILHVDRDMHKVQVTKCQIFRTISAWNYRGGIRVGSGDVNTDQF